MDPMGQHDMGLRERDDDLQAEIRRISRYRWVVYTIAALAAADVLTTWAGLGALTGFPVWHLGRLNIDTSWTLPFIMEGYAGFALQVWLTVGPGRTRRYAMSSALALLALSLTGQIAYHLMLVHHDRSAGSFLVGFAACLPVASLLCGAILMHLLQLDGEALKDQLERKREAERRAALLRAEADERAALRRELADVTARTEAEATALRATATGAQAEAEAARAEAENLAGQVASLTRKLSDFRERQKAGGRDGKRAGSGGRKPAAVTGRKPDPAPAEAAAVDPDDLPGNWDELDTEARVLVLVNERGYSASKAGLTAGVTDARGRQIVRLAKGLTGTAPQDIVREGDPET